MNHAGTVTRNARPYHLPRCLRHSVLAVLGLAVSGSAAAAVNTNGIEILSTTSTGVKSGQYIEAAASVAYQHVDRPERIYTKQLVPVSTATLRRGALAALSRGVMHPGLQVAIMAAGFALSQDNEILVPDPEVQDLEDTFAQYQDQFDQYGLNGSTNLMFSGGYSMCTGVHPHIQNHIACYKEADTIYNNNLPFNGIIDGPNPGQYYARYGTSSILMYPTGSSVNNDIYYDPDNGGMVPASESDLQQLDHHLPVEIVDQLVNSNDDIPEWQDEITVLPFPGNHVVPTNSQNVAPEVASQTGKWAENVAARLDGQPEPNADVDSDGRTSDDAMYESTQQPVPPFGEVEPEWQVETIDSLPSWSSGLSSGACPAPVLVDIPLYGTISIDYQPACDLASWLRAVVIAVCGILALYIVLGHRANTT